MLLVDIQPLGCSAVASRKQITPMHQVSLTGEYRIDDGTSVPVTGKCRDHYDHEVSKTLQENIVQIKGLCTAGNFTVSTIDAYIHIGKPSVNICLFSLYFLYLVDEYICIMI